MVLVPETPSEETAAVRVLFSSRPRMLRPVKVAVPLLALAVRVPVRVVDPVEPVMLSSTSGVPVVIRLPSASLISTVTVPRSAALATVLTESMITWVASPWARYRFCEV